MESPRARDHWERNADNWIGLTRADPHYDLHNKPNFLEIVPPPGRVTLDVGCGEGRMARELIRLGHRVVALDGSSRLATAAATSAASLPAGVADVSRLPIASAAVDLVVCFMVLMDVEELDQAIGEIARVLAPGGVFCMAILHPIITCGLFIDGDPNQTFYMGEYARPMRHVMNLERQDGQQFALRVEHRPIDRYSRALEAAGLAITHVREPLPSDDAIATDPSLAKFRRVPEFLHLRVVRMDSNADARRREP